MNKINPLYGITPENLLRSLPAVLRNDENMQALAQAVAPELSRLSEDTDKARIYTRIDELPEKALDILAEDFKVDWWDGNYSIEEKRRTLKDSWNVHRRLGTPWAVVAAISAIYEGTTVQEWFEYGGEPYHFRLLIPVDETTLDPKKHSTVIRLVNYYKNLRSVLEDAEYRGTGGTALFYTAAAFSGFALCDGAATENID